MNPARESGSAVSSPSGVWGRAPDEVEFGAFYTVTTILIIFLRIN